MQAALALSITLKGRALVAHVHEPPEVHLSTLRTVLPLLAVLVFLDGINSVVSGVPRGSGRQMLGGGAAAFGYFCVWAAAVCLFLPSEADNGASMACGGRSIRRARVCRLWCCCSMLLRWD
jgi:Na+-driven multidrug efflux pump